MAAYILADDGTRLIAFDLTVSEVHQATAQVTTHPVEAGVNVSDHVRPDPKTVSLEFFATQTPIAPDLFEGRGALEVVELDVPGFLLPVSLTPGTPSRPTTSAPVGAQLLVFDEVFDRVKELQDLIWELIDLALPVTVVTATRIYDDMILISTSLPRDAPGGATFSLDFQQIRIVQTATVEAPTPKEPRGAPGQNKGSQATTDVKSKDAVKAKSLAFKLLESAGI